MGGSPRSSTKHWSNLVERDWKSLHTLLITFSGCLEEPVPGGVLGGVPNLRFDHTEEGGVERSVSTIEPLAMEVEVPVRGEAEGELEEGGEVCFMEVAFVVAVSYLASSALERSLLSRCMVVCLFLFMYVSIFM